MSRTKGALGRKTLERMGLDKYKINRQNDGKKSQINRQNDDKPNRIRRTREQLLADGYYDKSKPKVKSKETKVETKVKNKDADRSHLFLTLVSTLVCLDLTLGLDLS